MKTAIMRFIICIGFSISVAAVAQENADSKSSAESIDSLNWMAGHWGSTESGRTTEEIWLAPKAGLSVGVNRSVNRAGKASFEYLRIEQRDDGVFYVAQPGGKQPTEFRLVEVNGTQAKFEIPKHDFPRTITYAREGDTLTATIAGEINGKPKSMQWQWKLYKKE